MPNGRENNVHSINGVTVGPDLNGSKGPLDKKLYRQIILPNGLRCVLIEDTLAMRQAVVEGGLVEVEDGFEDDKSDDEQVALRIHDQRHHPHRNSDSEDSQADENDYTGSDQGEGLRDAAVAILVGVGSAYDPSSCQGLAHFLEHLLFMGSVKYPGENDYESFVSRHGGSDNAFTEWEYTLYSLNIPQEYLWPALDRLAQFFIAPLLLESSVDRELKSIESEFQLNLLSDTNRLDQLFSATSVVDHPFAKFGWGNNKSLLELPAMMGVDPMKELRIFYERYYYAANIRLVICSAYTLDEMQEKVASQFSKVPALPRDVSGPFRLPIEPEKVSVWDSKYRSPISDAGFPLDNVRGLCKIFRIVPVKEKHSISITWQIPSVEAQWRVKPSDYLSHLLGHEANGSLLSYFRSNSLADSCVVGVGDGGNERSSCHAFFTATFVLSEYGITQWFRVAESVFQYIGMLRYFCEQPNGLPSSIYDELKSIQELSYRFRDEPAPDELVDSIAEDMAPHRNMPPDRILDGSSLLFEYDEDSIKNLLENYLTPKNCRIDLISSLFGKVEDFETHCIKCDPTDTIVSNLIVLEECVDGFFSQCASYPQIEPMFGTPFWCHGIPANMIDNWTILASPQLPLIDIHLPPTNPFLPRNFDLKSLPDEDADHPLLNASIRVCIPVGKTKQWFPATVIRYNRKNNSVLLSYEDEEEKWHSLDTAFDEFSSSESIGRGTFEGSLDSRTIKYRIVALSFPGKGAIRMFGDGSDLNVQEGFGFPAIPPPSEHLPVEVSNSNTLKMWWLQDRNFRRPISDLRLQFNCVNANRTPLHRACADLFVNLCQDSLKESIYLAEMCELWLSIESSEVGFTFRLHGFHDKLLDLFCIVIRFVLSFRSNHESLPNGVTKDRLEACLEVLSRKYKNSGMTTASLSRDLRLQILRPTLWSPNKLLKALNTVSLQSFVATISSIFENFAVEAFFHGNVDRDDADRARDLILSILNESGGTSLPREKYPAQSVTLVPRSLTPHLLTTPSRDHSDPNTSCEMYFQIGRDNVRDRTMMDMLVQILHEPFFDQLRTKDQFGYSVYCSTRWSYGIIGCVFHVTTNNKSATQTLERIDRFLLDFRQNLVAMNEHDFFEHRVALAKEKLAMFDSMSDLTDCLWNEIREGRFSWEAWREEAIVLQDISKEKVIVAYDEWLMPGKLRSTFAVQVIGANKEFSKDRPVINLDSVGDFYDYKVENFVDHICRNKTCGRVTSKLF